MFPQKYIERDKMFTTNDEYTTNNLKPETLQMMKELGIGSTRDKWELDTIEVGGFRLIKSSEMPSKAWTGPSVSDVQKASGVRISVRKTNNPETPLAVIRLA